MRLVTRRQPRRASAAPFGMPHFARNFRTIAVDLQAIRESRIAKEDRGPVRTGSVAADKSARAAPTPGSNHGGTNMKRSLDIAAIVLTALLLLGFAVLSLRGLIDPQQASGRRHAGIGCGRRLVLPGLSVPQSRHRHCRRNLSAVTATDAAGHSPDHRRGAAGVRYVGAVVERRDAASLSSRSARAHRGHGRAAVAPRPRRRGLSAGPKVREGWPN